MSDITQKKTSESHDSEAFFNYIIDAIVNNVSFRELIEKNSEVERQIYELKDHLSTIEKSKLILEEKVLLQEHDIRKYKEKIKNLKKNVEKLIEENINLKSENEKLNKAISEIESKYDNLISELRIQNDDKEKSLILGKVGFKQRKLFAK